MSRRLYSIRGNDQKLDGGAMFGNAPKKLWERWAPADDHNRIDLATRALVVHDRGRFILFEAGIGAFLSPRMRERYGVQGETNRLLTGLELHGLSHEDIHVVVLSHLHFDHAGGLLTPWRPEGGYQLVFPNARFVVGARAWERANAPHFRDRASFIPELHELLEASGRLELIAEGQGSDTLGPDFSFTLSDGHTPGLLLTRLDGDGGSVAFCGDLIPGAPWVHLPVTMGYDRYPELLIEEKQVFLGRCIREGTRLLFTHDHEVAMASVSRDDRGKYSAVDGVEKVEGLEL